MGAGVSMGGKNFGGAGHQKDIVEGQGFADGLVAHIAFAPFWSAEAVSAVPHSARPRLNTL